MTSEYRWQLPIGDWSGDGHGKADWFTVVSAKPVDAAREAFFAAKADMGYGLDEVCGKYMETSLDTGRYHAFVAFFPENADHDWVDTAHFAHMVANVLNYYNPELNLRIVDENLDMLPFSGYDDQGRYIGHFGYGLLGE